MGWIGAEKCLAKYPKDIEFSPIRYIDSNRYKLAAMGSLNCSNRPGFLSLVILFAAAAVFCAYSQEKPSVAVLPFEPLNLQEADAGLAYSRTRETESSPLPGTRLFRAPKRTVPLRSGVRCPCSRLCSRPWLDPAAGTLSMPRL
jgi:hypothetical protein